MGDPGPDFQPRRSTHHTEHNYDFNFEKEIAFHAGAAASKEPKPELKPAG